MPLPNIVLDVFHSSYYRSASIRAWRLAGVLAGVLIAGTAPIRSAPAAIPSAIPPTAAAGDTTLATATKTDRQRDYGRLPMHFEPDQGQSAEAVKFLARGPGYALCLTQKELVLSLRRGSAEGTAEPGARRRRNARPDPAFVGPPDPQTQPAAVLRLGFVGANPAPVIEGLEPLGGHSNYLVGNDPEQWRTGIPHYARVRVKELYAGIDLVLYGNPQHLEYDFVVTPGADPGQIRLSLSGAEAVRLDAAGDLVLDFPGGVLRQRGPTVYQDLNGERRLVKGGYRLLSGADQRVGAGPAPAFAPATPVLIGFQVAAHDPNAALVIDPVLVYSTYLGGAEWDSSGGIAVDAAGNAYVTGFTASLEFPATYALYPNHNGGAGGTYVAKLNAAGTALVYSTYFVETDWAFNDIAVDDAGNAYLTGSTRSQDFPTTNALYPENSGGYDAFVAKLNAAGTALVYSTYLGGTGWEFSEGIATDTAGNVYLTGQTGSLDFPTANALYPNHSGGEYDGFVVKLNAAGTALVYSTYLGGTGWDSSYGIATDTAGNAYVTGETESHDFPMVNALHPDFRGGSDPFYVVADAFVAKLNAAGSALVYSTYLGGESYEVGYGIAADSVGNAYVVGTTYLHDFPTTNAIYPNHRGDADGFVAKLNAAGSALVYSTFLGGSSEDGCCSIAVDTAGNAYVAGYTESHDFPTANALYPDFIGEEFLDQPFLTYGDVFVARLNATGTVLDYSTYLGGNGRDNSGGIAADSDGSAYVTGTTRSLDFPTANAIYPDHSGFSDVFVVRIDSPLPTAIGIVNISTRGHISSDISMHGGFVIRDAEKTVLIRGLGPTLADGGVTGALSDPVLTLYQGQQVIAESDSWIGTGDCDHTDLVPDHGSEPCIMRTLEPGAYTAIVRGADGSSGKAIVSVNDMGGPGSIINLSTRGRVIPGVENLTGGFVIREQNADVLVKALGPTLGDRGVADILSNPKLTLYSGQTAIATNDSWQGGSCAGSGLEPGYAVEPCIRTTLAPGAYTAIVTSANGSAGTAIVSINAMDDN